MWKAFLYLGFLIVFQIVASTSSEVVPVFIWEEEKDRPSNDLRWIDNSNRLLPTDEFGTIVQKHLAKEKNILVFLQDKISVEDFSEYSSGGTPPFVFLKDQVQHKPRIYFPKVSDAVKGLQKLEKHFKVNHELADNHEEIMGHLAGKGSTMVYVHLPKTSEESREEALKNNDKMITEIVKNAIWSVDELVVIFTGEKSSNTNEGETHSTGRQLLAATEPEAAPVVENATVNYQDNCSLVYIGKVSVVLNGSKEYFGKPEVSSRCENASQTSVSMKFTGTPEGDVDLVMKFKGGSKRDWKVTSIELTASGNKGMGSVNTYRIKGLYAPRGFSYKCSGTNYFRPVGNSTLKLALDDLMMQPLFGAGADGFGREYNCVGFFTAPILAGIMVTLMFAIILYWALSMVMGIQTMDQFDDPKGASISVPQAD